MVFKINQDKELLVMEGFVLPRDIKRWDSKDAIRSMVVKIAVKVGATPYMVWGLFYRELYYNYGIDANNRKGDGLLLDRLSAYEVSVMLSFATDTCKENDIDITGLLENIGE